LIFNLAFLSPGVVYACVSGSQLDNVIFFQSYHDCDWVLSAAVFGGVDPGGGGPGPPNILIKDPCINQAPTIIKLQNVHLWQSVVNIMKCLYCLNCPKFGQLIYQENH